MTVTASELRQQWEECLRLLDRDRVRERQVQSTDYYNAQGRMVSLLWANAGDIIAALERDQEGQMTGYEANWSTPTVSQSGTAYYCETCKVPMGSLTSDPIRIRGPITLPADAVCAACGRSSPVPASWTRIIETVLARVLAGEPAAQVVADYPDEHGSTIEGLEKVERLVVAAQDQVRSHPMSTIGLLIKAVQALDRVKEEEPNA